MLQFSIIIVNYNADKFIKDCLESIKKSDMKASSYEIIIVDNNSSSSSQNNLKGIADGKAKLIINEENVGFAKANNQAIRLSHAKYILLLNPDTVISSNTLSVMSDFMDKNPDVGVSTCKVELQNGQLDDACHRGFPTPWNAVCHFMGISKLFPASQTFNGYHLGYSNLDKIHSIDSCVGAFMVIRKEIGEKIGWFDEKYFWYGEDLDFCYQVKKLGSAVMYVPHTKILHYKGVSSGIKRHSKDISGATNETKLIALKSRFDVMKIFYEKNYTGKYPHVITKAVLAGIELKKRLSLLAVEKS